MSAPARSIAGGPILKEPTEDAALTRELLRAVRVRSRAFALLFALLGLATLWFFAAIFYTFAVGIGAWGNNIPVAWAFAIINFVWWIGIGHAGTFISAFLLLLQQSWRTSINRIAEAMTLFAVVNAGLMPLLHLGRPWFAYYLVPYPSTLNVWPNFRGSLPWDVAAIATYSLVSLLFWYTGLIPDLATARDRCEGGLRRRIYGVFALGWNGSSRAWEQYRVAYGLLAALATPLVISVHSIVSTDFAITLLPGWHSTIFPPYFVVGAIYSGFAMVITLVVPLRRIFRWESVITERHLDTLGKVTLLFGWLILYSYVAEYFSGWYSGEAPERYVYFTAFMQGPYASLFWLTMFCNCVAVQILWVPRFRRTPWLLFGLSLVIQLGMWLERFVLIVGALSRDFLPSAWHLYAPTWVDLSLLLGSIGFFFFNYLLFLRFVPAVPIAELKQLRDELAEKQEAARPGSGAAVAAEGGGA